MTDPDPFVTHEANQAAPTFALSPDIADALRAEYGATEDAYDGGRLRVGADLRPDGCDRSTVYRLRGTPEDPKPIRKLAMLREGKDEEHRLARSFTRKGEKIEVQGLVHPLRPSFWAWAPGHFDVLRVEKQHLHEIKVTDAPTGFVSVSHRWQMSFYFHELERQGRARTASWIYFDRSHGQDPLEVPLTPELLIPLADIVAMEEHKSALIGAELPPRPTGTVVVEVLKGKPRQGRVVRARLERYAWCQWCAYLETCQPGPATQDSEPSAGQRQDAIDFAETAWSMGSEKTPQVSRFEVNENGEW